MERDEKGRQKSNENSLKTALKWPHKSTENGGKIALNQGLTHTRIGGHRHDMKA